MTTSEDLTNMLADLLALTDEVPIVGVSTFSDAGVLASNDGLVVR